MNSENAMLGTALHKALADLLETAQRHADAIGADFRLNNQVAWNMIGEALMAQFAGKSSVMDQRTAKWRCRFRLYDNRNLDEPEADSDDDRRADMPGTQIIAGLPNVATELATLANHYHVNIRKHGAPVGLSERELAHRLRSLRPTISRRGGDAVWRVPYEVLIHTGGQVTSLQYLARVDIQREEIAEADRESN